MDTNCVPGLSHKYSTYGSDHPLIVPCPSSSNRTIARVSLSSKWTSASAHPTRNSRAKFWTPRTRVWNASGFFVVTWFQVSQLHSHAHPCRLFGPRRQTSPVWVHGRTRRIRNGMSIIFMVMQNSDPCTHISFPYSIPHSSRPVPSCPRHTSLRP